MAGGTAYKRILLKLSGESLCSADGSGIDVPQVAAVVEEILPVVGLGVQLGIVVGGGNFVRARALADQADVQRVTADHMGMLGTVINALALRDVFETRGQRARVMSAIPLPTGICGAFNRRKAIKHLEAGHVVLFAGGTGSPFFTTDTTAALRACEIGAELIVKATKVDGVYDSDPLVNPDATMFERLTYQQALQHRLGIMDMAAFSLCAENGIRLVVCQVFAPGNLMKVARGERVGTLVTQ